MPIVMKQVFDTMSEATGVDFTEIMRAGTYDAKVNRNVNLSGDGMSVHVNSPSGNTNASNSSNASKTEKAEE